jgi:hypothetical protein
LARVSIRTLIEPLTGCGGGSCARSRRLLREQTAHLLAALHSEGIEALAAQLQQLFALGVAQLYCFAEAFGYAAHQAVGALVVAGDAVEGEPCPPSA